MLDYSAGLLCSLWCALRGRAGTGGRHKSGAVAARWCALGGRSGSVRRRQPPPQPQPFCPASRLQAGPPHAPIPTHRRTARPPGPNWPLRGRQEGGRQQEGGVRAAARWRRARGHGGQSVAAVPSPAPSIAPPGSPTPFPGAPCFSARLARRPPLPRPPPLPRHPPPPTSPPRPPTAADCAPPSLWPPWVSLWPPRATGSSSLGLRPAIMLAATCRGWVRMWVSSQAAATATGGSTLGAAAAALRATPQPTPPPPLAPPTLGHSNTTHRQMLTPLAEVTPNQPTPGSQAPTWHRRASRAAARAWSACTPWEGPGGREPEPRGGAPDPALGGREGGGGQWGGDIIHISIHMPDLRHQHHQQGACYNHHPHTHPHTHTGSPPAAPMPSHPHRLTPA